MKIKIIKAQQPYFWYANHIGEIIEVKTIKKNSRKFWWLKDSGGYSPINQPNLCIIKSDAEVI